LARSASARQDLRRQRFSPPCREPTASFTRWFGVGWRAASESRDSDYYGSGVTYAQLLFGGGPTTVPAEAKTFQQALP
jgi:hypothetical protein